MDVSTVKKPAVQTAPPPKRPEQVPQAHNSTTKPKEPEAKKAPEAKPAPVVNTQGHSTGRLLNVTA